MVDLRKIQAWNGLVIIRIALKMPWRHTSDWVSPILFGQIDESSAARKADSSPTLLFMTHMCLFIFSNPCVKWDLYSNPRCSKRHHGAANSQSHFGDECALFPLHNVVKPMRLDTLYIAPKPHQVRLAAKLKEIFIWDTHTLAALTILALWAVMHTFHFLDCLSLVCLRMQPNTWQSVDNKAVIGECREESGSNLLKSLSRRTRHSWSKTLIHLWQIINPLWVFIIINSYSSTSKGASWRGRLSFSCWLGSISKQSWQQEGTPCALRTFSRQEHIPPPFATLNTNSQRSDRIMCSQTREAPGKLFYLPWLFFHGLPQATLSPFIMVWVSFIICHSLCFRLRLSTETTDVFAKIDVHMLVMFFFSKGWFTNHVLHMFEKMQLSFHSAITNWKLNQF